MLICLLLAFQMLAVSMQLSSRSCCSNRLPRVPRGTQCPKAVLCPRSPALSPPCRKIHKIFVMVSWPCALRSVRKTPWWRMTLQGIHSQRPQYYSQPQRQQQPQTTNRYCSNFNSRSHRSRGKLCCKSLDPTSYTGGLHPNPWI